jgi:CheY-like chemotaxis protein
MACAHTQLRPFSADPCPRILVAEDHPINQILVRKILERNGFDVVIAADGAIALSLWRANPECFDLILMDVQMPNLDGIETTRRIRQDEFNGRRPIPIVALTAHAMNGDAERCLAAGMDAYLSKPIEIARLVSTLERFLADTRCGA